MKRKEGETRRMIERHGDRHRDKETETGTEIKRQRQDQR